MDRSESIKELAAALAQAQQEIEGAKKDAINPFLNVMYADLASITEAVRGIGRHGLSYVQVVHDPAWSEVCEITETDKFGKVKTYTSRRGFARVETLIFHSSGEWLSSGVVSIPVYRGDAQTYTAAVTYGRRTSLGLAFGVAPEDDDGESAVSGRDTTTKAGDRVDTQTGEVLEAPSPGGSPAIGREGERSLFKWADDVGIARAHLFNSATKNCKVKALGELTPAQVDWLKGHLKHGAKEPETAQQLPQTPAPSTDPETGSISRPTATEAAFFPSITSDQEALSRYNGLVAIAREHGIPLMPEQGAKGPSLSTLIGECWPEKGDTDIWRVPVEVYDKVDARLTEIIGKS